MSDVERIKAGVVLRLHAMQPNDREAVIFIPKPETTP